MSLITWEPWEHIFTSTKLFSVTRINKMVTKTYPLKSVKGFDLTIKAFDCQENAVQQQNNDN